jgi:phosphoglycerate dehydrogenase-like enzyme
MISAAFILDEGAFASIYGEECLNAIVPPARLLARPITDAQLAAHPPAWLEKVEALFTAWGGPRLDAELLARMPKLRAVFYGAGTLRFIATDACWERDLVFTNAAAVNARPTAEFAYGAILLSLKRAWQQAAAMRNERRHPSPPLPVPTGCGGIVGLVSLGHVGRRVAEKLRDLEVTVLAHDPFAPASLFEELELARSSLEEIFVRSDIISLHAPLLPSTTGMVDARLLSHLKPGATLINTARGGIVDEPDLIAMLRMRPDVQAIIDVTDPEPPVPDSPLYELPNLFLTPHIAGSIGSECRRMGRAMVEEFHRYARGEPLRYAVAREQFARMA